MYRCNSCNSLIGFGGEMNDMLSVSVVRRGGTFFVDKLSKQSTPDKQLLTYQDAHILQYL